MHPITINYYFKIGALFASLWLFYVLFSLSSNQNLLDATVRISTKVSNETVITKYDDFIDFEDFDNVKGLSYEIIPNIVHLLYLNQTNIKFYEMVNIFSIFFNQKPDKIYFHCDKCSFSGKYFNVIKNYPDLWKIITIHKIPFHKTIFGKEYGWINHHRSDIWRLQLLMEYGGIYLDGDVYVVNSLDKYRRYETVVSWDQPFKTRGLGVQVYIAHRNARLLKAHFDQYRVNYQNKKWYYNAGFVPASILLKYPFLAHIVEYKLGTQDLVYELFGDHNEKYLEGDPAPPNHDWNGWKQFDTIHLLINHRFYLDRFSPIKEFNETNIWTYNQAYGEMVRTILRKANLFLP